MTRPDGQDVTYDPGLLAAGAAKWARSAALRAVYGDIFCDVAARLRPGRSLEVGSGIGVMKQTIPGLVTSDVVPTSYADRVVSAYALEQGGEPWANIIAMDVLHHLRRPLVFFASAAAALEPGGRLLLVEPAATAWGRRFYRCFHHEPCQPEEVVPPFEFAPGEDEFANMGMGWSLFETNRDFTTARLEILGLELTEVAYRDVLAYPATGGFSRPAVLPAGLLRTILAAERRLPARWRRLVGLRMVVVMSRRP
jgi:SAM-dependent methyltransferase